MRSSRDAVERRLEELFQRRRLGAHFTLDTTRALCAALGQPERRMQFVHIAGTNGKGSVAAMCTAVLQQDGVRTGLYTSPHLCRYRERFRVDGREITNDELAFHLGRVIPLAGLATFFEISTAVALSWFAEVGVEIAVWEVGLGGRLDATNVVTPLISVITRIGLDHEQYLGSTLARIAAEKAGIIKPGVPVVSQAQEPEVMQALFERSRELQSPVTILRQADLDEFPSPLTGEHQRWNTALAVAAVRTARPSLGRREIEQGLAGTIWPGRCQEISRMGRGPVVLVDGAHNPMGARALSVEIERRWGREGSTLIFGALADKNVGEMARVLDPVSAKSLLVPVRSSRSCSALDLKRHFPKGAVFSSMSEALTEADRLGKPIVIAGSLFLAGEALALLNGDAAAVHPNETLDTAAHKFRDTIGL